MKRILVIDGQGGSLGKLIVEKICSLDNKDLDIIAVGTNVIATQAMLRAGASEGATGENPVVYNSSIADIIIGPIGIAFGNALNGEITPAMALAVTSSLAHKIFIPINKCNHVIVGLRDDVSLSALLDDVISELKSVL